MKPKLVVLSAFLTPFRSGAEAMVEEVFPQLTDWFDVTIVTCRLKRTLPREEGLGLGVRKKVKILRVGFGFSFDKYLFPLLAPFAVRRLQPEIIHAVLESYAGAALILCKWIMPGTKRVLTLQSTNTSLLLGPIHRSADRITAISRVLIERAKKFGREDVTLIPNGIDLQSIRGACQKHSKIPGRILFVGRLERMKGVDVLLAAFARGASGSEKASSLHIVGDGSLRSMLESQARSLGIEGRVVFLGRLTDAALYREYAEAEIFCGLSRSEALGNVFLEARTAECAIIATRVGGIPDIVSHEKTGLLVPPNDAEAAAKALVRLLNNTTLCTSLVAQAKEGVENYAWERIAQRYLEILH
jgi:glycosyltransferase involved in cell wall biosynthesis